MSKLKLRHKVLICLFGIITTVMIGAYIYSTVCYYKPEPLPQLPSSLSLKDQIFIDTLFFVPVYLGTFLLWFLGVKTKEFIDWLKLR